MLHRAWASHGPLGTHSYRKHAPQEWDVEEYSRGGGASIREWLAAHDELSNPVVVEHKPNRAVIFDSRLFHETDRTSFKKGCVFVVALAASYGSL